MLSWFFIVMGAAVTVTFSPTDGRQERVMFDKITSRIQKLCYGLNADFVDPVSLSLFLLSCSLPLVFSVKSQQC